MEIREVQNKNEWNTFVLKTNPWSIFQLYEWGEIHQSLGGSLQRIALYDKDSIVGLAQVLLVKARRGTHIHVRHGPVLSRWRRDYLTTLVTELVEIGRRENAWFIRISPMLDSTVGKDLFTSLGFRSSAIHAMDAELCWVLDLLPTEEILLKQMRKTTRYLVKQAEKMGVTVEESANITDFLNLYHITSQRHRFVEHKGIEREFELFGKKNQARLYVARYENKPLAAAVVLHIGKHAIYHHGASLVSKVPATYLLQWTAIREAKRVGCELYNFWGIAPQDNPKHPWRGITLFKQGFGGEEKQFMHAQDLALTPLYGISYGIEWLRKVKRGY